MPYNVNRIFSSLHLSKSHRVSCQTHTHQNTPNDHLQTSKCHGKTNFTASLLNFLIKTHIKRGNLTENTITLNCDPYSEMCAQNLEAHAIFDVLFVFCEIYHF